MEPSIHIRALDLRCPSMTPEDRRRLATVAARELPAALARTAGTIDDGRLIFVRRLDACARLVGGSDQAAAARWAEAIAVAVRDARDIAVFERPLDALVAFVEAALGVRPGEAVGRWPWTATVLEAIRSALSSVPALDGRSHAFAAAPLPVASAAEPTNAPGPSIEWALVTAGALLPSLVAELAARDVAARALGAIGAPVAAAIVDRLVGDVASPEGTAPIVSRVRSAVSAWPSPIATDPRNQLLVAALVLDQRPSLRGTSALAPVRSSAPASASPDAVADGARGPAVTADAAAFLPVSAAAAQVEPSAAPDAVAAALGADAAAITAIPPLPLAPTPALASVRPGPRLAGSKTAFAGLLFLLDPLRRLELPEAILDEPALASEPGLPAVLYGTVCRLLPDAWADPSAFALTDDGAPQAPPTTATPDRLAAIDRAAARVATAAARLPATPQRADLGEAANHGAAVPLVLSPWLDRFCCRAAAQVTAHLRARLDCDAPLAALAHKVAARPGSITITRTHIDVTLEFADVDLDVRRAALDINPGWVPFLGRIVSFHYL